MNSKTFATTTLRDLIKSRFADFVGERGFERERADSLFYPFRRRHEARHDLIEVQFDKYHRPKFVVNFGQLPAEGIIDAYGRFVDSDSVGVAHLVQRGRLYPTGRSLLLGEPAWFAVRWWNSRRPEKAAEVQIEKLIRVFTQLEEWFRSGKAGPSLRIHRHPINAPGAIKKSMEERGIWPPTGWTEKDEKALRM